MASKDTKKITELNINYIKTNSYRTYHVDGVYGGLTPGGKIYLELFIERRVVPQVELYNVKPDGSLGDLIKSKGKEGVVREIEAGLIMDIDRAKALKDWLDHHIKSVEKIARIKE